MPSTNHRTSSFTFIDSVVSVTANTDREMLEGVMAETIHDLTKIDLISISRVTYAFGKPEVTRIISINPQNLEVEGLTCPDGSTSFEQLPHFKKCFETQAAHITLPDDDDERTHSIYPMINLSGNVFGFLELYGKRMSPENEYLLFGLLQVYRNYMLLLEESEVDTLTGLLNRRTFDANLDKIISQSISQQNTPCERRRHLSPDTSARSNQCWLAVLDIDFFKKINDTYGHIYGDEVLLLLANLMRQCFRCYDKLFRFGGEEFVIILKATDKFGASQALSRLHSQIANHEFPKVGKITVSIGYVEIRPGDIPTEVLSRADEALYYAKEHGRNQIHSYEDLVAANKIQTNQAQPDGDIELF